MPTKPLLILIAICCMAVSARSQDNRDVVDKITGFPSSFFNTINKQSASLEDRLTRQTEKYLARQRSKKHWWLRHGSEADWPIKFRVGYNFQVSVLHII